MSVSFSVIQEIKTHALVVENISSKEVVITLSQ